MPTTYFKADFFAFLDALRAHNNRAWFHEHKDRYEASVREPFLHLIADLQPGLTRISRHYIANPRRQGGSLYRIQRDIRYARDKSPYKTWAAARFFHERARQTEAPGFYLHFGRNDCFIGAGIWQPQPATLKRIRAFLADNPRAWQKATQSAAFRRHFQFTGSSLVRPPQGFDPEHPLLDDLKRKDFVAVERFEDAVVLGDGLKAFVLDRFQRLAPLVDYLCASLDLEF